MELFLCSAFYAVTVGFPCNKYGRIRENMAPWRDILGILGKRPSGKYDLKGNVNSRECDLVGNMT